MKEAACYMLCQLAGKEANGANVRLPPPAARRSEVLGLSSLLATARSCSGSRCALLPCCCWVEGKKEEIAFERLQAGWLGPGCGRFAQGNR